jgi:drug/metabolite transporter (DMT)-like permease
MNKERRGIFELLLATFFFSLFGVFTRLISGQISVFYQLFIRALIMSLMFYLIARLSNNIKKVRSKDWGLLLFRGLLVVVDFSCFYYAVSHLPLGLTLFLFYASNVITSFVFGALFLGEKMNPVKYVSLVLAITGLFVMYNDSLTNITPLALLATTTSGICFGLTTTTSKKLTDKYDSIQINLIGYLAAFVLVIPALIVSKESVTLGLPLITWTELLGFSLVGVGAFYLTLDGFKLIEAQKGSIIMLAELIFVTLLGLVLYSEIPSLNTLLGGLFILLALIIPNVSFDKNKSSSKARLSKS